MGDTPKCQSRPFIGIDPGLVHTGAVAIRLDATARTIETAYQVVLGPDADAVRTFCRDYPTARVFIEAYRPRSAFGTDPKMTAAVTRMRDAVRGSVVLDNTGVKKVVTPDLMKLLGVWTFPATTHHQDLRSAARIGLYGALKDDELNALLTTLVTDHVDGRAWKKL